MALPTLSLLKSYLGSDATEDDALLQVHLDAAIDLAEKMTGLRLRQFDGAQSPQPVPAFPTGQSLYFDPVPNVATIERWKDGAWEDMKATFDAQGITEVHGYGGNVAYVLGLSLLIDDAIDEWFYTYYNWRVTFTADSNAIPTLVSDAILRLAAYSYRARDAQAFDTVYNAMTGELTVPKGIPIDAKQKLDACRVKRL